MARIKLDNVSLDYPLYHGSSRSLKKALLAKSSRGNLARDALERVTVRALSRINLDIQSGDRIGFIGPNGAGKTSLLKVLAGIYSPTTGTYSLQGKVSALLDTQVGLDMDATGYENILLRGMYMDIHPREMKKHVEEIAAFTELGDYLELPVRTYSAGMMIRLGFAISTCITPEILLMDEWFGAGDEQFIAKARKRLEEYVRASSILVLTSHSLQLIQEWCTHGLYLKEGTIRASGPIADVVAAYQADTPALAKSAAWWGTAPSSGGP